MPISKSAQVVIRTWYNFESAVCRMPYAIKMDHRFDVHTYPPTRMRAQTAWISRHSRVESRERAQSVRVMAEK